MIRSLVSPPLTNRAFIKLLSIVLSGTTEHQSTSRSTRYPAWNLYLYSVSGSTIKSLLYIGVGCLSRRLDDAQNVESRDCTSTSRENVAQNPPTTQRH